MLLTVHRTPHSAAHRLHGKRGGLSSEGGHAVAKKATKAKKLTKSGRKRTGKRGVSTQAVTRARRTRPTERKPEEWAIPAR